MTNNQEAAIDKIIENAIRNGMDIGRKMERENIKIAPFETSEEFSKIREIVEQAVAEGKIEAYKHLNMTYWDNETDSIPCDDIDREIAKLQTLIQQQGESSDE